MDMATTTRSVSTVRTAGTVSVASPVDSEAVTAWELQVPMVFPEPALSNLWPSEAKGHQALPAGLARDQVPPVAVLLQPQGLNFEEDSVNK